MKQIIVGNYSRGILLTAVRKTLLPIRIVLIATIILLVLVPYLFSDKIFGNTNGSMSNVVYVDTDGGTQYSYYITDASNLKFALKDANGNNYSSIQNMKTVVEA